MYLRKTDVPYSCADQAFHNNQSSSDLVVFSVYYNDCETVSFLFFCYIYPFLFQHPLSVTIALCTSRPPEFDWQLANPRVNCLLQPWIFCRHRESTFSQLDMAQNFGRLPVKMRNYVRHALSLWPFPLLREFVSLLTPWGPLRPAR